MVVGPNIDIGIAVYKPNMSSLVRLVGIDRRRLWLFLNSPLTADEKARLQQGDEMVHFLNDGTNVGVGTAYNQIMEAADRSAAEMVLLLDQDSLPSPDIAARLNDSYRRLRDAGERPAVVAAVPVAPDQGAYKVPRQFQDDRVQRHGSLWPAEFVISSGSLIDIAMWKWIGPFQDDFFIDAIDIEWCFRAQARDATCWMDDTVTMIHQLGTGVIRVPLVNWMLAKQPPERLYTYVRNQLAMLSLRHVPYSWRRRIIPYLIVQSIIYVATAHGERRDVMRALRFGMIDGLRKRLGAGRRSSIRKSLT